MPPINPSYLKVPACFIPFKYCVSSDTEENRTRWLVTPTETSQPFVITTTNKSESDPSNPLGCRLQRINDWFSVHHPKSMPNEVMEFCASDNYDEGYLLIYEPDYETKFYPIDKEEAVHLQQRSLYTQTGGYLVKIKSLVNDPEPNRLALGEAWLDQRPRWRLEPRTVIWLQEHLPFLKQHPEYLEPIWLIRYGELSNSGRPRVYGIDFPKKAAGKAYREERKLRKGHLSLNQIRYHVKNHYIDYIG